MEGQSRIYDIPHTQVRREKGVKFMASY